MQSNTEPRPPTSKDLKPPTAPKPAPQVPHPNTLGNDGIVYGE